MDVSKQNYDLNVVKNNLEQVSDKLNETADKLKDGVKDKVNDEETKEEAKGFFASLAQSIRDFFSSLFGNKDNAVEDNTTTEEDNTAEGDNTIEDTTSELTTESINK